MRSLIWMILWRRRLGLAKRRSKLWWRRRKRRGESEKVGPRAKRVRRAPQFYGEAVMIAEVEQEKGERGRSEEP